ncbi:putative RNA-directed DNA polymerase, eukaryota, reverse transcriptase zinc-binding domain protein [Tanacetum coccineum]
MMRSHLTMTDDDDDDSRGEEHLAPADPAAVAYALTREHIPCLTLTAGCPSDLRRRHRSAPMKRTALMMEEEARVSRAAWAQSMDACNQVRSEGISLRTTIMAQQSEIAELQAADRRRQTMISDLLKADYRYQRQKRQPPMLSNEVDQLEWHNSMGVVKHFSVREVWETIRPSQNEVLKTQDRLRPWDSRGGSLPTCCPLCDGPPDSHDHLFFDCAYSSQVWNEVKSLAGLPNVVGSIVSIVNSLIPIAKRRTIRSVIAKLVVAATSYYIWQERNSRLFANKKRSHGQLTECIKSTVRLKLLSCMFKKSKDALFFKHLWDLPNSSFR